MPRSPSIRVRPAVPSDLRACARVFVRSAGHLARRLGEEFTAPPLRDMAAALGHILSTDPLGFHVATAQGRIVAFAATIVRGRTHFLSMFWALPDIQGRGVGRRVLARAFAAPKKPQGAVRCVYASLDTRAQVLYLKFGMQPRSMIYRVTGKVRRSPRPVKVPTLVQVGPVGPSTKEQRDIAARYDRELRLARRDADHVFLGKAPGARFFEARYRGRRVGYVCLSAAGRIGPACVSDASLSAGLTWASLQKARELRIQPWLIIPGLNEGALRVAFEAGLRLTFPGAWMADGEMGDLRRYLLASGILA